MYHHLSCYTILYYHAHHSISSCIIINNHVTSCIIKNHRVPLSIIMYYHILARIIIYHQASSFIINYRHVLSCINTNLVLHQESSCIITHTSHLYLHFIRNASIFDFSAFSLVKLHQYFNSLFLQEQIKHKTFLHSHSLVNLRQALSFVDFQKFYIASQIQIKKWQ